MIEYRRIHARKVSYLFFAALFSFTQFPNCALSASQKAKKKTAVTPKVTIRYTGTGSATFQETYTEEGSQSCPTNTVTANETASSTTWDVVWSKIKPSEGANPDATTSSFSADVSRSDGDSCHQGPTFQCNATLGHYDGFPPELRIEKSGKKGFIVTVFAESRVRGTGSSDNRCIQSSVFDNAITEGSHSIHITAARIKLTPGDKSKTTDVPITIQENFDCKDPAKEAAFISTSCNIATDLEGNVQVTGKWKAKLDLIL